MFRMALNSFFGANRVLVWPPKTGTFSMLVLPGKISKPRRTGDEGESVYGRADYRDAVSQFVPGPSEVLLVQTK